MKERVKQFVGYHHWKYLFEKYERILMPVSLLIGVAVDFFTFWAIELHTTFLILGVHLILAGAAIIFLNTTGQQKFFSYARLVAPFVLQFSFGALLSASLIFYWFSGALSVSWPLLFLFAILMMSNEVFRHYYLKPLIQLSVYFFVLFSILSLILPSLLNSLDVQVFILSGLSSLIFISALVFSLSRSFPSIKHVRRSIFASVLIIFALMNGLYFFDLIPPIPLSLRDATVAHSIEHGARGYVLQIEEGNWIDQFLPGEVVHLPVGKPVYVYSAIFAPTALHTNIFHQWQYFDETKHVWIDKDRLSFPIKGGRDAGYRGYSLKTVVAPGKWRVNVQTQRGQTVGRVGFVVETVDERPELTEVIK